MSSVTIMASANTSNLNNNGDKKRRNQRQPPSFALSGSNTKSPRMKKNQADPQMSHKRPSSEVICGEFPTNGKRDDRQHEHRERCHHPVAIEDASE